MSALTVRGAMRRFVVLTVVRWVPVGLLLPLMVLLPLDRGLGLAEIGAAFAVQGMVVLALELPSGGFADSLGRRQVLLVSATVGIASLLLFLIADSFWWLVAFAATQGVYRALDSGPLEAWYVDTVLDADPRARIEAGMSAHGAALGLAVALGALLSGALVALDPMPAIDALVLPVLIALVWQVLGTATVAALMIEDRPARASGMFAALGETPRAVREAVGLLRGSRVLLALIGVELLWGFGMVTFESLMPVRLAEAGGGPEAAAALTGPAVSAAWGASAVGAAVAGWTASRVGTAMMAMLLRILQGICVVLLGAVAGVVGLLTAYLACYLVHGSSNALHSALLHRQVGSRSRATVISLNSMVAQPAGSLGLIVLTGVAEAASTGVAMVVGGVVLALAAPLYLPALRQERRAAAYSPGAVGGRL